MPLEQDAILLRIVVGQYEHHDNRRLYECILLKARELNLRSGAVVQGRMGFGPPRAGLARSAIGPWDVPEIVELLDTPEKVNAFIDASYELLLNAQMSLQKVTLLDNASFR